MERTQFKEPSDYKSCLWLSSRGWNILKHLLLRSSWLHVCLVCFFQSSAPHWLVNTEHRFLLSHTERLLEQVCVNGTRAPPLPEWLRPVNNLFILLAWNLSDRLAHILNHSRDWFIGLINYGKDSGVQRFPYNSLSARSHTDERICHMVCCSDEHQRFHV